MKVFLFDFITKAYSGEGLAYESPIEKDVFHIPSNATIIEPLIEEGKVPVFNVKEQKWEYRDITGLEMANTNSNVVDNSDYTQLVIARRNKLLIDSDYTQLGDVKMKKETKQAWIKYRQELRDITKQEGFPESVEWPVMPGSNL